MKIYLAGASIAALALTLTFGGYGARDAYYPVAAERVREVLDKTDLPVMVFGHRGATAKHWRFDKDTSMWALLNADQTVELLRLSVKAVAEGDGTRLHFDVLPPEGSIHDQVARALEENSACRDLYRHALAEQVDAKLTNREFDMLKLSGATARVTLMALPHIKEGMDNAEVEHQRHIQENVDRAYANEGKRH